MPGDPINPEWKASVDQKVAALKPTAGGRNVYSSTPLEDLLRVLEVDPAKGLNESEVTARRAKFGPNEMVKEERDSILKMVLEQFKSPVVCMLLVACVACLATSEILDGCVVFAIVFFNACLATYTEKNAGDALERSRQRWPPRSAT